jgi:hypothetical protein
VRRLRLILARIWPGRGQHCRIPGEASDDTVIFPRITDGILPRPASTGEVSPSNITLLDLAPPMARPYVTMNSPAAQGKETRQ